MRNRMMLPTAMLLTLLSAAPSMAAPVVVSCGPGQRAVVHDTWSRGSRITRVTCVRDGRARYVRYRRARRSWGKSALIIGGSTATGAGIGGIAGGRRGALIGGALGGGAASIYEGAHRR